MDTFWGAMIGMFIGVQFAIPLTALLMAAVFKPHKSFEVKEYGDIAERVKRESSEVPTNFKYSPPDDHPTPPDISLDPSKR